MGQSKTPLTAGLKTGMAWCVPKLGHRASALARNSQRPPKKLNVDSVPCSQSEPDEVASQSAEAGLSVTEKLIKRLTLAMDALVVDGSSVGILNGANGLMLTRSGKQSSQNDC